MYDEPTWQLLCSRPRYGPGPKTAAWAGLAWWVIVTMQSGKWVALLSIPPAAVLIPLAATLPRHNFGDAGGRLVLREVTHAQFNAQSRAAVRGSDLIQFSRLRILDQTLLIMTTQWPNHALLRTAVGHRSCNRRASWPPSLSFCR